MSDTPAGITPLHVAVQAGSHSHLTALLLGRAGLSARSTEMLTSITPPRDRQIFQPASDSLIPVDFTGPDRALDKGANPLHLAASVGDLAAVALLTHKARPKTRDGRGARPDGSQGGSGRHPAHCQDRGLGTLPALRHDHGRQHTSRDLLDGVRPLRIRTPTSFVATLRCGGAAEPLL